METTSMSATSAIFLLPTIAPLRLLLLKFTARKLRKYSILLLASLNLQLKVPTTW